jgi:hypothetical protein
MRQRLLDLERRIDALMETTFLESKSIDDINQAAENLKSDITKDEASQTEFLTKTEKFMKDRIKNLDKQKFVTSEICTILRHTQRLLIKAWGDKNLDAFPENKARMETISIKFHNFHIMWLDDNNYKKYLPENELIDWRKIWNR